MNVRTKDLARIAASVASQSSARSSREEQAQHNSGHPVRSKLHVAMTVGLVVAVVVLALKLSEESSLRRQVELRMTAVMATRLPTALPGYLSTPSPLGVPPILHTGAVPTGAAQVASSPNSKTTPGSHDRAAGLSLQQLRPQLSDPAARNVLRGQQRSAVLHMYGDLLRSWRLPADKSDRVLDLLAERQLREIDRSLAASDTSGQGTTTRPGAAQPDVQSDVASDDLKTLLTDAQRAQLSQQQATLSERLTVSSFSDELSLAQMPMTDSQQQQLIQIMYDERTAIPAPTVDNSSDNSPDAQRALNDWQSALEQRVQDRATTVLTSAQQTRYEQFLSRQREARNVFASFEAGQTGDNANAGGVVPPSATASPQGP